MFGKLPLSTLARWPHPPADPGIHYTCHISTVYSHTTLAKSFITACCCCFFTCRSRGVFGKPCVREVVFVYSCSVASPTCGAARWPHLPAVLRGWRPHPPADPGIQHTCHISTVYSHTTLAKNLITACFFFFTCRSRGVFGKFPLFTPARWPAASPTCGPRYSHLPH